MPDLARRYFSRSRDGHWQAGRNVSAVVSRRNMVRRVIGERIENRCPRVQVRLGFTGIPARARIAPTQPMRPGQVEKREFEYTRPGTQTRIANFEVGTGRVIAPTVQLTRDEKDFAKHLERTVATDPEAGWIFVADHRTTHGSETLVLLVAGRCALPIASLGKKGKSGVMRSVRTRQAFWMDPSHRVRFVDTPKHTSWLNPVVANGCSQRLAPRTNESRYVSAGVRRSQ
jgi:hypothetical protein